MSSYFKCALSMKNHTSRQMYYSDLDDTFNTVDKLAKGVFTHSSTLGRSNNIDF